MQKNPLFFWLFATLIFFYTIASFISAVDAGTLVCNVTSTCSTGVVMFRMASTSNSHSELPTNSFYPNLVCCSGVSGLGNNCAATTEKTILRLSSSTNAHVEENTLGNYSSSSLACISVGSGQIAIGYQQNNCGTFDTTIASISSTTNAHAGDGSAYPLKVCGSATSTGNSPPIVSSVKFVSSSITLTPLVTTTITVVASTTDPDGVGDIRYATSTIYRTALGANCTTDNKNCYQVASTSCSFLDTTSTVSCSADIWYFAQATDSSSSFPSDTWSSQITVTDSVGNGGNSTSTAVELNTLLAISLNTSTISYGTVIASSTTGSVNQSTTVQNAGNSTSSLQIFGTALLNGAYTIVTSSQHYATNTFTFGGTEQQLSGLATAVSGFTLTAPTSTNAVSSPIFWGLMVAAGNTTGTYSGTLTFAAVFAQ